jgi:AraC-like DNA-binding protein
LSPQQIKYEPWGDKENEVERYGKAIKAKAIARLLPPESASLEKVSQELGISRPTLNRWRTAALCDSAQDRTWTAAARFDALVATRALEEVSKNAWCRENGVYPQMLEEWQRAATQALAEPEEARAKPCETKADRRRIKELERELHRKEKALAEAAALLVLSKKLAAIFPKDKDGDV